MTKSAITNESNENKEKGAKKGQTLMDDNNTINKQPELPDSITYNQCKQVFTEKDVKILCCDCCET